MDKIFLIYYWQPLEDAIFHHFIPALVGKPVSDLERALFVLPVRLGGLHGDL